MPLRRRCRISVGTAFSRGGDVLLLCAWMVRSLVTWPPAAPHPRRRRRYGRASSARIPLQLQRGYSYITGGTALRLGGNCVLTCSRYADVGTGLVGLMTAQSPISALVSPKATLTVDGADADLFARGLVL